MNKTPTTQLIEYTIGFGMSNAYDGAFLAPIDLSIEALNKLILEDAFDKGILEIPCILKHKPSKNEE